VSLMNTLSSKNPAWWDQELDPTGKPIRLDVRSAAREVWNDACTQARALLGEPCEAAGFMERSVVQISRYLNRRGVATSSQDTNSLLMCAFCRALRRHVVRLRRVELAPELSEAAEPTPTRSCTTKEDCRLDAEKAALHLSEVVRCTNFATRDLSGRKSHKYLTLPMLPRARSSRAN
jgi:hypothetical protein